MCVIFLRLHLRWEVWVLVNFHWCEPFFSSPPKVSSSTRTERSTELLCRLVAKSKRQTLAFSRMQPLTFLSDLIPLQLSLVSIPPVLLRMGAMLFRINPTAARIYWTAVVAVEGSKEPLQLVNGTDGRAILASNKACRETGLLNDARGHVRGIYDGSFTCEWGQPRLREQGTARARNARTRHSLLAGLLAPNCSLRPFIVKSKMTKWTPKKCKQF